MEIAQIERFLATLKGCRGPVSVQERHTIANNLHVLFTDLDYVGPIKCYANNKYRSLPVMNGVHVDFGIGFRGTKNNLPNDYFIRTPYARCPRAISDTPGLDRFDIKDLESFLAPRLEALHKQFESLVAARMKEAEELSKKHSQKLDHARARAQSPEAQVKRDAEARERARDTLVKLFERNRRVLDGWPPAEVMRFMRLASEMFDEMRDLAKWANTHPRAMKSIDEGLINECMDLAHVKKVMDA